MARASVFDAIFASSPVNRSAAAVTSKGDGYVESRVAAGIKHWKAPPKVRAHRVEEMAAKGFQDLTGRTVGRFHVLGRLVGSSNWVVRCSCGDYEARTSKAIKNPLNSEDMCIQCRRLRTLRERETKKAKGIIPAVTIERAVDRLKGIAS